MNPSLQNLLAHQQTLKLLAYDIQNATQVLALKQSVERIYNILADVVFAVVSDAQKRGELPLPAQLPTQARVVGAPVLPQYPQYPAQPAQVPVMRAPTVPTYQAQAPFDAPPMITQPINVAPSQQGMPEIAPSDKMNVVITPTGTTVIPPVGGMPVTLPPQAHVDAAGMMEPAVPPPAPPGVLNVVLPRGGAMPVETQSAVAAATQPAAEPDAVILPGR